MAGISWEDWGVGWGSAEWGLLEKGFSNYGGWWLLLSLGSLSFRAFYRLGWGGWEQGLTSSAVFRVDMYCAGVDATTMVVRKVEHWVCMMFIG